MPSLNPPLPILTAWLRGLPSLVSGQLSFFVLVQLGQGDHETDAERLLQWLEEELPAEQHAGRAVCACALVDYHMEEFGRPGKWDEMQEMQLTLVEADLPPEARGDLNEMLGSHDARRGQWLAASDSWWQLRARSLANDSIRVWETDALQR